MSECTPPADVGPDGDGSGGVVDLRTDDGLRQVLGVIVRSDSWDVAAAHALLTEIRRRAARNAKHVASMSGVALDRGLVDDVLLAAWMILRRHGENVLAAARPWAYLMRSAQRQVLDEVRAQQLLTKAASIRGRTREVLPRVVLASVTERYTRETGVLRLSKTHRLEPGGSAPEATRTRLFDNGGGELPGMSAGGRGGAGSRAGDPAFHLTAQEGRVAKPSARPYV